MSTLAIYVASLVTAITSSSAAKIAPIIEFTKPLVEVSVIASAQKEPVLIVKNTTNTSPPPLTARAYIVQDAKTGQVLAEKHANTPQLPASTTKIMTALVALEEYELDEIVTVDKAGDAIGHTAALHVGEKLTVHDVLKAVLISSGNDAAVALALHHSDGYTGFVAKMNQFADALNLQNTNFANVSGLESPNHHTSAHDLAVMSTYALKNPIFKDIVGTPSTTITSIDKAYSHQLTNINKLLSTTPGVKGVKTGWTPNAKECLVTYTTREDNEIIVVILGSDDRFGESEALIEWTYANHSWQTDIQLDESEPTI